MGSLYHKKTGKVAILSAQFVKKKVHYLRDLRAYIVCLAPQPCFCCQIKNQAQDREGAWVWDYEDDGQYPIKLLDHMSKNLSKVFYAIQNKSGLQSSDFFLEKRVSPQNNNRQMTYVTQQQGQPEWFIRYPDKVKAAWFGNYANKDIVPFLGKNLTYIEQQQTLNGNPGQQQVQGSYNNAPANNAVSNYLNSNNTNSNPYQANQNQNQNPYQGNQPQNQSQGYNQGGNQGGYNQNGNNNYNQGQNNQNPGYNQNNNTPPQNQNNNQNNTYNPQGAQNALNTPPIQNQNRPVPGTFVPPMGKVDDII